MLEVYIKRIVKLEIPDGSPDELLKKAKTLKYPETLVSNTFLVTDKEGIIQTKEKIAVEGDGVSFTFTG